ncbi:MAG: tRNA preQ1(34) S-adenosylmethionine ribosyltransferase-isomerase QueA [Balneolaceae bacterium]|nr:tRNA preQ1(34) S-adenosylmethionine ribosyltransferase-isomerase QueA [Balneolaceae bacterium]
MPYNLSDFNYELPEELIAQQPSSPRDHARLLVYDRESGSITDDRFYNIADHLHPATTLVANNSRVEPCRLLFEGGSMEIFILEELQEGRVRALVRPGRKFREGRTVDLGEGKEAEVLEVDGEGIRTLRMTPAAGDASYAPHRRTPFPPYIEQDESLSEEYQTVYARSRKSGASKAAPTAGLHFTPELLRSLKDRGWTWTEVTLHVGLGTFAPVKADAIEEHTMHGEEYEINERAARELNRAGHLTAVGTTSVRVLEAEAGVRERFEACRSSTDIFIRPGYEFRAVDALITNFHLPKSTLLMLVAAMTGLEEMHRIYRHAMEERYRFYSFGDAMLIR